MVTALATYIIFGPVFSMVIQPRITQGLAQEVAQARNQAGELAALVEGKSVDMAQSVIAGFIGVLKIEALVLLGVSLVLIVLGSIWHRSQTS